MEYYDATGAQIIARQQLRQLYYRNGVAYAITRQCLLEQRSIKGRRSGAVVLGGLQVNIDTEIDLLWANFMLEHAAR